MFGEMERIDGNDADTRKNAGVSSKSATFGGKIRFSGADDYGTAEDVGVACSGRCLDVGGGAGTGDVDDMEIVVGRFDADGLRFDDRRALQADGNEGQCSDSDITEEKVEAPSAVEEMDFFPSCLTPVDNVFDPFAPCSEEVVLFAPRKRVLKLVDHPLCRKIDFSSCSDSMDGDGPDVGVPDGGDTEGEHSWQMREPPLMQQTDSKSHSDRFDKVATMGGWEDDVDDVVKERRFVDSMYRLFLDVIVSNQIGKSLDGILLAESPIPDGLKTPTAVPLLTGVADTCPGAPCRPSPKSRNLSPGICRKLEF